MEDRTVPSTITWTNPAGGSWQTPGNWDLNRAPTSGDDVVIPDLSGAPTITYGSSTSTINSLTTSENVILSGGTLNVTGAIQSPSIPLTLQGGTLAGATIASGTSLIGQGGILDGVTVDGNWQVVGNGSLTVEDGLTLNGTLSLGDASSIGYLNFNGTQTLDGTGSVVFGGATYTNFYTFYNGLFITTSGTTLTIGSGLTVSGKLGYLGRVSAQGNDGGAVVNHGTIQADVSGGAITINGTGAAFANSGSINANLGTISITAGSFGTVNNGTFAVGPTGTLSITGPFSQSPTGNFDVVLGGSASSLYGHAAISGTASLNGTLNVGEANGFSPNTGDIFTFLTYTSATGQFADYTGLTLGATAALQPAYNTGNATLTTVTSTTVAPDLRVTDLALNPSNPQSSQNVTVTWNDFNAGNGSAGASWIDHLVVTNTTTGQTLVTADVSYDAITNGSVAPNGSTARSYIFRLPDGVAGVGNLQISVTTDSNNGIAEFYPGNIGETNNTSTLTTASTLAQYPALEVRGLAVGTANPQSGQNLTIVWSDANTGQATTAGNWTDQVTVVNTTTGQTLVSANVPYNASVSGNIAAGGTSPQLSYSFRLPDGSAGAGALKIAVTPDANGDIYEDASLSIRAQATFATGSLSFSATVADVNGDGKPDIVTTNFGSANVSVLLGNGDGTFQPQQTFATGPNPIFAVVADVNGDGKPDIVVANRGGNSVSVLPGNGDGTFQSQQTFATGSQPYALAVADVNGDGKPDVVVTNARSASASVLLGNGNGTFQAQQTFPTGSIPIFVAAADVNGDGKPDIVVAITQQQRGGAAG